MTQSLDLGDPNDWDAKMRALRRMMRRWGGIGVSGDGAPVIMIQPLLTEDGAIITTEDSQDIFA